MFKLDSKVVPHVLGGLLSLVLLTALAEFTVSLYFENQLERKHSSVVDKTAIVKAKIEGEFNAMLFLSAGLMAHVATHPEIGESEFNAIAGEIVATGRNIRNIGLARDNVITHIYPLSNNVPALGLVYQTLDAQWPAVKRAMDIKGTVVAGPVKLVQGGSGLIVRTPIYTRQAVSEQFAPASPVFWGMASIVIDTQGFFTSADFHPVADGIEFAIRGQDGLGEHGDMIIGNAGLFNTQAIISQVSLPNGNWQLAAMPVGGWQANAASGWMLHALGWLIALLISVLITTLAISRCLNRDLALHDHLTKLPNRRLLEDRMSQVKAYSKRYSTPFGLFNLDLDGFKRVNDVYGHKMGDALLIEASNRMLLSVRGTDTVARLGGDEFIILVNDLHQESDMSHIRQQLEQHLMGEAVINGHRLEISASIGFAVYPEDGETIEALLMKADERMYEEKHQKNGQAKK